MTTPAPPNLADITGILLADGWHAVTPGTLLVISDPAWASTQGVPITLGPFFGFVDGAGVQHAFRYENALAFRWAAPPP